MGNRTASMTGKLPVPVPVPSPPLAASASQLSRWWVGLRRPAEGSRSTIAASGVFG